MKLCAEKLLKQNNTKNAKESLQSDSNAANDFNIQQSMNLRCTDQWTFNLTTMGIKRLQGIFQITGRSNLEWL